MYILIIEDDPFFQKFYSHEIAIHGYEVDVAENGKEGLSKALERKPDLILLDIIMPIMDGFEVLTALQKNANLSHVPVIVFSTLGQESDIIKAKKLGAKDYINKSFFDLELLLSKISAIIK